MGVPGSILHTGKGGGRSLRVALSSPAGALLGSRLFGGALADAAPQLLLLLAPPLLEPVQGLLSGQAVQVPQAGNSLVAGPLQADVRLYIYSQRQAGKVMAGRSRKRGTCAWHEQHAEHDSAGTAAAGCVAPREAPAQAAHLRAREDHFEGGLRLPPQRLLLVVVLPGGRTAGTVAAARPRRCRWPLRGAPGAGGCRPLRLRLLQDGLPLRRRLLRCHLSLQQALLRPASGAA